MPIDDKGSKGRRQSKPQKGGKGDKAPASSPSKPVASKLSLTKRGTGARNLDKVVQNAFSGKANRRKLVPAELGAYVNGRKTLKVDGRPGFVWARIGSPVSSEVVQIHNDKVSEIWSLPIRIYRDPDAPDIWRTEGRDVRRYQDWGSIVDVPPHGASHSFSQADQTGIDPAWVFKRQYMPFLPRPIASGTMQAYIESDFYQWGGQFRWFGGTGTADLTSHKPTGAVNARFVTVYLEGDSGQVGYLDGPEFPVHSPPEDPGRFISIPSPHNAIPIAAIILMTGTSFIGWGEIYDLRYPMTELVGSGSFLHLYDHGAPEGEAESLDFIGSGVSVTLSGTRGIINIPGGGGGAGAIVIWDNGVFLGTGSILDFGDNLNLSISGSVIRIDAQAGGSGGTGSALATYMLGGNAASLSTDYWQVPVYPYATGSLSLMLNGLWQRPSVDFEEQYSISGTFHLLAIPPTGSVISAAWGIPAAVGAADAPIYPLVAAPIVLGALTGMYWRTIKPFVTGSLALFLNGLAQRPGVDYQEQHAVSGTFEYLVEGPPTGSFQTTMFGVRG